MSVLLQDLQTGTPLLQKHPVPPGQEPSAPSNEEDELDKDSGSKVTIWPTERWSLDTELVLTVRGLQQYEI